MAKAPELTYTVTVDGATQAVAAVLKLADTLAQQPEHRDMANRIRATIQEALEPTENEIQRAQRIAAEVHAEMPNDADPADVFTEFKRRLGGHL